MQTVGIRELKNRLSQYLRQVRGGKGVLVTDRGRVVAELCPPPAGEHSAAGDSLERLVREGRARLGLPNRADLYPVRDPALVLGNSTELLDAERGER